jgi:glycosyltransferase involved in cell wall biosynthesis
VLGPDCNPFAYVISVSENPFRPNHSVARVAFLRNDGTGNALWAAPLPLKCALYATDDPMTGSWQAVVFRWSAVRWALALLFLLRATLYMRTGRRYRALIDFCWIVRVSETGWPSRVARREIDALVAEARHAPRNPVIEAFRKDPACSALAGIFQQSGRGGRADIFRDLIVLKAASEDEKGVILLKYVRTFAALVSLYDLPRLMQRYTFVLEPCWAGYCEASLFMYLSPGNPVLVQCFTEDDYRFISEVGAPFVPLRMGPADWVNIDNFQTPPGEKRYDLVMVANWAKHKRHRQLFRALRDVHDRDLRVLLVGFPWHSRTADDIRREAAAMRNPRVTIEIIESVPQARLGELVAQSRVFVFLSRKEGDNKALVESFFADVPAIVYAESVGGARSRINPSTGLLAHDHELAVKIQYMLDHCADFSPRAWALQHTGSAQTTRTLNAALRAAVQAAGGRYSRDIVEKTNAPNLAYRDAGARAQFEADYNFVNSCLLKAPAHA